ncbi:MAG: valine--tRNA ligase [Thermosynechococcaceae cyanobacterium MS004]|nr:valine--tRNA ligase [Thermosynechococcaceae cyanobacterium MS004]
MTASTAPTANLSSQYEPSATESKWQQTWEDQQVFKADPAAGGEPYCVVIPPPNVTGSLHMGHAFESALIDTLVRYHRMVGRNTLWLPGTDHASIAVQTILERQFKAEGKTRDEVGRTAFLERAWQWKAESGGTIVNQLRRLGVSVDWSRERFTMDEGLSQAVLDAFVRFFEEGLIYRGNYMVNWCPASQSAVSDLEVESKEVDGNLWHFRYLLTDGSGFVEVATTRPETMLGDTAVAVNPDDDRYRHLIGKTLKLPILDREIPIIGDELVDPAFGTGCVKVTPAHDPNDFEMGRRHSLPFINILNKDGTLNENGGPFEGLDRFEARKEVLEWLASEGVLVKTEDYRHTVPYSDRGKVPVEPLISTQWFVKIEPLAQRTLAFLDEEQSPNFVPERWGKVYRDWLVNLKDWCISRQLWWGHQIPAWYAISETEGEVRDDTPFVVARSEAEAREKAIAQFGEQVQLQQDADVLDTWFSSGLWPFSTLGWPEQTQDFAFYYPTATLVTGFDIIFFWVARMTLMASHFTGQIPFKDVYIHGLVRDENNKKMSKSANNGIDPLLLIEKYGTDALRYTLIREVAGAGQDIRLDYSRETDESNAVEASRNFANKLWNASRFVLMNLDGRSPAQLGTPDIAELEFADRWILTRYQRVVLQTRQSIETYGLGEAAKGLYEFIRGDFCDWYIELVKPRLRQEQTNSRRVAQQTLAYVLDGTLRLLHPFMPHITEEIWQTLTQAESQTYLATAPYPTVAAVSAAEAFRQEAPSQPRPEILESATISPQARHFNAEASRTRSPLDSAVVELGNILKDIAVILDTLPGGLLRILTQYRSGLLWIGAIATAIVSADVLLAIIDTLNRVPLVGPFLEVVGLTVAGQFIYKRLLWKENREQFIESLRSQKSRIVVPESVLPESAPSESALPGRSSAASVSQDSPQSEPEHAQAQDAAALANAGVEQTQEANLQPPESAIGSVPTSTLVPTSLAALLHTEIEAQFELLINTIRTIRNLRTEASIKPGLPIAVILQSESDREREALTTGQVYIQDLAKVSELSVVRSLQEDRLTQTMVGVTGTVQVLIPLAGVIDVEALKAKLEKDLAKAEKEVQSYQGRLQNPKFVDQAPAEVVQGARETLAEAEKQVEILGDRLSRL